MEAAANAPANIFPSRAILITPERSENIPPSAARTSGVANLIVDQSNAIVKMSLIVLDRVFSTVRGSGWSRLNAEASFLTIRYRERY
jgi:hypothetical protein